MKKLLSITPLLLVLITVHVAYSQGIDINQLEFRPVTNMEHICTLDPTDINAHLHIAPSRAMLKEMQQVTSIFEIDYRVDTGNSCGNATWPSQTREAFEHALDIWSAHLRSDVALRIDAVWSELEGSTLGSAGPTQVARRGDVGEPNTWYAIGQLTAMSGEPIRDQVEGVDYDIAVNINCSFDNWYFGTDAQTPTGQIDFVTVVLHEIGHGLGFFGTMSVPEESEEGGWGLGEPALPIIFDRFAIDGDSMQLLNETTYPNPSAQLFNTLTGNRGGVFFDGEDAKNTLAGESSTEAKLYTPSEWSQGSSFSHLDQQTFTGTVNSLMRPRLDRALAMHTPGPLFCGMLNDMGWPLGAGCLSFLAADAVIALDTRDLDFGVINLGENNILSITVSSDPESVELLSGTVNLEGDPFSIVGSSGFELEPGQSAEITIQYNPGNTGIHTGLIQLFHNAKNEQPPITIELTGETLEEGRIVQLDQSYPNPVVPSNPVPRIPYSISRDSNVKLDLYTVNGQHVRSMVNELQLSGRYEADVDVQGLSSGIYIYRILVDGVARSGKLMLVR